MSREGTSAYFRPTSMYGDWMSGEKFDERDGGIYTRTRLSHSSRERFEFDMSDYSSLLDDKHGESFKEILYFKTRNLLVDI